MIKVIYFFTFCFTILSIVKHTHTNWLLKNSKRLRLTLENSATEKERLEACKELEIFTNKYLKSSSIYSIFALVLDFLHNRHPK